MPPFFDWFFDSVASEEIIDLYFILSDLVDIELTEAEICEIGHYDALSTSIASERGKRKIPLGKLVL